MKYKSNIFGLLLILGFVLVLGAFAFFNQQKEIGEKELFSRVSKPTEIAPHYVEYSERAFAKANGDGRVVLFFWAPWCSTCSVLDDDLRKKSKDLPNDLTIVKVNFDTEKVLKRKYNIITQHTLVQIDKEGNEIKKWIGGNVDLLKEELQ